MAQDLGLNEFNKEKFKQVLHYIIAQCENIDSAGKTVLFKIQYFSDFNFYELFEEKMTGETYRRIDHGPAPMHFTQAVRELDDEGKIEYYNRDFYGMNQIKYKSLRSPDTSLLTQKEIEVIDSVIETHGCKNASEISDLSHLDVPYMATKDKCLIDYELVFYRDPITSVRVYGPDE